MNFEFHSPTHLIFGAGVLVDYDEDGNLPGRPALTKEDIAEVLRSAL